VIFVIAVILAIIFVAFFVFAIWWGITHQKGQIKISVFTGTPLQVSPGDAITLKWETTGGETAALSFTPAPGQTVRGGVGNVAVTGNTTVYVNGLGQAMFVLTVSSSGGARDSKAVIIEVR
jgi:hypothetical protein